MDTDIDTHDELEDDLVSSNASKRPRLKSIDLVPVSLKGLRFGQRNIVNNNIRKLMVPFQYGFEHSEKLISQSKIKRRRMSDWSEIKNDETDTRFDLENSDPNATNEIHSGFATSKKKRIPVRKLKTVARNQKRRTPLVNLKKKKQFKRHRNVSATVISNDVTLADTITLTSSNPIDTIQKPSVPKTTIHIPSISQKVRARQTSTTNSNQSSDNVIFPDIGITENNSNEIAMAPNTNADGNTDDTNDIQNAFLKEAPDEEEGMKLWNSKGNSFSSILFRYYDVLEILPGKKYLVACKLCDVNRPPKLVTHGSNSNLKSHIKRIHAKEYAELIQSWTEIQQIRAESSKSQVPLEIIQNEILRYIIKERLPISKVESVHFNRLINICMNRTDNMDSKFLSRKVARSKVMELSLQLRSYLMEKFKKIQYMAATSDIWSRDNRSFMAVCVHFIDPDSGNLNSNFIACERFIGSHVNEAVAHKLKSIFDRYEINGKVFFVTTDEAGEYKASFRYHGDNYESIQPLIQEIDTGEREYFRQSTHGFYDHSSDVISDDETDSEVEIVHCTKQSNSETSATNNMNASTSTSTNATIEQSANNENISDSNSFVIHELFLDSAEDGDEDSVSVLLPNVNHISCAAHMLNNICKKDALTAFSDSKYEGNYTNVFRKLNLIWNVKSSRIKAELFTERIGQKIVAPHRIRWRKMFDAIQRILNIDREKLRTACNLVGISILNECDYQFLEEYQTIIRPVAEALKLLEGDNHTFGLYLPILFGLKSKLDELSKTIFKYGKPLLDAVQGGFKKRFGDLLNLSTGGIGSSRAVPLYMAMITNPQFKMNFLPAGLVTQNMLKVFQDMLITAGEEVNAMENHDPLESPVSNDTINEDKTLGRSFLVENDVTALFRATTNLNFSLMHEVHMYLTTPPTNMDCCKYLSDFPTIRKLYLKYNSIRTSEAICERLFRYAG